jgi:hypothetical protein
VDITHRDLDGVVPGDVLQRKSVRVLSRLDQKRVAQSVKSGIRIELNLITGKLFPETPHFRFEYPWLEFLVGVTGLAEYRRARKRVLKINAESKSVLENLISQSKCRHVRMSLIFAQRQPESRRQLSTGFKRIWPSG